MKRFVTICVSIFFCLSCFSKEVKLNQHIAQGHIRDRIGTVIPIVTQEENVLYVSSSDSYETKMLVTIKDGNGQTILSEILFPSSNVRCPLMLPYDLEDGAYIIEIYCGDGNLYCGYFELYN